MTAVQGGSLALSRAALRPTHLNCSSARQESLGDYSFILRANFIGKRGTLWNREALKRGGFKKGRILEVVSGVKGR